MRTLNILLRRLCLLLGLFVTVGAFASPLEAKEPLDAWLKDYIPEAYPAATVEDHGAWAQAHVPGGLVVSWSQWNESGVTLKQIEAHALKEGKSIFVSKDTKEDWQAGPSVAYFKGAGYYIDSYSSASMSGWNVESSTVIQFDGDAKDFAAAMAKAWVSGTSIGSGNVEKWGVFELSLEGPAEGNPYLDVTVSAVFKNGDKTVAVPGFYDGDGVYRVRFSPDRPGQWSYITKSDQAKLSGQSGSFTCVQPTAGNHGPVRPANTHYLEYSDGSPYYAVGTTSYQWTSVKQSIQEKTLETLATSPFNKMRMCVFPKSYSYGNDTEPWALPFEKAGDKLDPSQPNYEFFQNFDKRVAQLMKMGVQADVILFHPYDRWGHSALGKEMNESYVRHMIARLSAYRNVWWSLANEWDVPRIKDRIDWDGIGTLLQKEDPHQRFRGIHNWYYDESHFYDHSRPWVTHVSAQTYFFFNAIKWREQYKKPLLYDEMRYEGDVKSGWGKLTAKEMTSYFWKAGLSGVYGTHGDTFKNDSDAETEVRWWAKGGTLMGQSPDRIAFFKKIMEEAPVNEMSPARTPLSDNAVPDHIPDKNDGKLITALNNSIYTFSKAGAHYLAYTEDAGRTIKLDLAGDQPFSLQVIDTWNMKIIGEKTVEPGKFNFETKIPFTALRLISTAVATPAEEQVPKLKE